MAKIITISRSFSSGGRKVAKALSEELNYKYYDKQLINEVAEASGLAKEYVEKYSEASVARTIPLVYGRSFASYYTSPSEQIQIAQTNIIKELAKEGDSVFVGRCADYILQEEDIFKVFIYSSDMDQRIERCFEQVPEDRETKSKKEVEKEINKIDKERRKYYEFYTGLKWSHMENYNLCIDTSKISTKTAVELIINAIKE